MSTHREQTQKTVLVVDDSPLMRRLITEIVEEDPELRVVDVAENGKVALQKVREQKPDCVLLDVEMPELSGLDTLRRLGLRSSAKIVLLSYLGEEGSRVRAEAFRLGAVAVIDKPTGAVSRDLQSTRGKVIRETLRRALGLAAAEVPGEDLAPDGALATASILSVHIPRFTSLCERVPATALVDLLNDHFARVDDVTQTHGGIIDAQVGGATLAAFGVPRPCADYASRAFAAAGELLEAERARRAELRDAGAPFLEVGITIATGLVLAGDLGPPGARRYRTMGGAIDLAARLGRATEIYGADLIVCGRTLAALAIEIPSRRLDVVQLEPGGEPVVLYEILLAQSPVDVDADALTAYARGMEHYEAGHFAKAIEAFDDVLRHSPSDRAATRLRARCRMLLRSTPNAWHGVWPFDGAGG